MTEGGEEDLDELQERETADCPLIQWRQRSAHESGTSERRTEGFDTRSIGQESVEQLDTQWMERRSMRTPEVFVVGLRV